ncbi:ATP-binding protein [Rhizocola hellebori]|uniref:ATP-binding protein n=1 Tax=Rhizocola hellebori TaxID=1392758 RepID=UPI00194256DF|nr:helix-turn-helix transcriptional regulator [Rhizocola hellebori]
MTCPEMVGRSAELDRLRDGLARAQKGSPAAVIVTGEAGIGKTRLLNEFLAGVGDKVRVVRGGCVPLAEGLQPLAPVGEMLRSLARDLPELPQSEATVLAALLSGQPPPNPAPTTQSQEVLPTPRPPMPMPQRLTPATPREASTGEAHEAVSGVALEGHADQARLFATLRRLLFAAAENATMVVVLEDLHWADASSRSLLSYLVHGMRHQEGRMLLIGTCRSDELPDQHPLRALLAELSRAGAERIELGGLGPGQVADQMAGILSAPVADELAARMHARCGGNPFLVEEVLAAGASTGPLPQGTRDILLQRVRRLNSAQRHLLLAVAVAGRTAQHELLAAVLGTAEEMLLSQLRTVVDEHLLIAVERGYAFRHALVAEALVAEALPQERVRLHRAYAEALTGRASDAAETAYHWCEAGDPVRGLIACVEAGLAAEGLFAQSEACRHFDRAIQLWDEAPPAHSLSPLDFVELCRHAAEAAFLDGDTGYAIAATRNALRRCAADTVRAGTLYERLGRYLWANGNAETESIGAYESAVQLAPAGASAQRARALTGLAGALTYADRPDAAAWCEEALQVARSAGAQREEGRALQSLGYCEAMAGNVESGLSACRDALGIATRLGHSEDLYRAYTNLAGVLRMAGRTAEAAATAMEGAHVARRHGADRTYGNLLLGDAVDALILLGRWDEADAALPDEPDIAAHGTPVIATNLWLSAAGLHTWRGRFDRTRVFLDACMQAYATHGHGHVRSMLHANHSELCLWQGQYEQASRWISTELDLLGPTEFTSLLSRLVLQGLRAEAGLTRPADLTRLVGLLEEMSRRPDPPPDAAALIAMSWAELGRIRGDCDPRLWSVAAQQWVKLDMPWPLAYSRWRLAEVLLARRPDQVRRRAGADALAEANAIAARLGAEPLRLGIVALARRTRLLSAVTDRGTAAAHPLLTDREREVAALLRSGATNRRIAQQLFISEKTVSVHVSNILAKLGAANRGEAAAIVHRDGL